ncbi:MAG TPA: hypothetical protein VHA15_01185 [Burkholderiales bacterium]|nr:hypothetical protein [Burkholderiales bacterium]
MPALLAVSLLAPLAAAGDEAQDLKAAIVMRCYYAVGEFGSELVDRCVRDDTAAYEALGRYPPEHAGIVRSCTERRQGDGFARIRACVDDALKAGTTR